MSSSGEQVNFIGHAVLPQCLCIMCGLGIVTGLIIQGMDQKTGRIVRVYPLDQIIFFKLLWGHFPVIEILLQPGDILFIQAGTTIDQEGKIRFLFLFLFKVILALPLSVWYMLKLFFQLFVSIWKFNQPEAKKKRNFEKDLAKETMVAMYDEIYSKMVLETYYYT